MLHVWEEMLDNAIKENAIEMAIKEKKEDGERKVQQGKKEKYRVWEEEKERKRERVKEHGYWRTEAMIYWLQDNSNL